MKPGKMLREVLRSFFKRPATNMYPHEKLEMPERFRGKIAFYSDKCVGCKLCMKDCPTQAITIDKVGEKKFQAVIDLDKCIYCAQCVDSCLKKALEATKEVELAQLDSKKLKVVLDDRSKENTERPAG